MMMMMMISRACAPLCANHDRARRRHTTRASSSTERTPAESAVDPLEKYAPPHRAANATSTSGAASVGPMNATTTSTTTTTTTTNGDGNAAMSTTTTSTTTTTVSSFALDRTRAVLNGARVGDLLRVAAEAADGSGRDAAGTSTRTRTRWFVVRGGDLSAGGRRLVSGELEGKLARILDQGKANQARIGVAGARIASDAEWLSLGGAKDLRGYVDACEAYERFVEREDDEATLVTDVESVMTYEMLEDATRANPSAWTAGEGAHSRRIVIDDRERATKMAGELLALKHGAKHVVLTQLASDANWRPACDVGDSVFAPYAAQVLEDVLRNDPDVGIELSRCTYPDGGGLTGVVYRKEYAGVARMLARMGAQAARPIAGAREQILVGLALGYSEENITYHVRRMNADPIAPEVLIQLFDDAREEIANAKAETA